MKAQGPSGEVAVTQPAASGRTGDPGRAVAALAALSLLWAYNWVVMKRALDYGGAFEFTAVRGIFATMALFLLLVVLRKPLLPGSFRLTCALGLLQMVGNGGLAAAALVTGGAGRTAVLVYLMPFWTLVVARFALNERVRGWQWVAVTCAFTGLTFIIAPWRPQATLAASLFATASGIFWCLAAIVVKRYRDQTTDALLPLTAWQMLFGTIVLCGIALAFPTKPIEFSPYMIFALFYNAVPVGVIGWLLWLYALDRLPAGTASLGTLAIPVLGVIAAAVELGERPPSHELAGMTLVLCGLALLAWIGLRERRRYEPAPPRE